MKTKTITSITLFVLCPLFGTAAFAEGGFRNRDAKNPGDLGERTYPDYYRHRKGSKSAH